MEGRGVDRGSSHPGERRLPGDGEWGLRPQRRLRLGSGSGRRGIHGGLGGLPAVVSLVPAWMDSYLSGETAGLRNGTVTNESFRVWLEDSDIASANSETIAYLVLSGPGDLTTSITTNPIVADTDGDTLKDGDEAMVYRSSPVFRDTDGDSIRDDVEVTRRPLALEINGTATTRMIVTAPYTNDTDGDGLLDQQEIAGTTVFGVITDPSDPDTDHDGMADGQERYVKVFRTEKRYPITDDNHATLTEPVRVSVSSSAGAIEAALLMTGITHPDMGQLKIDLLRTYAGTDSALSLRNRIGAGEANNFTSFDLLKRFSRQDFTATSFWKVRAYDQVPGKAGQVEYAQIQVTIRTSPVRYDSDGDGLNDSEEIIPGKDGFQTDPWNPDTDGDHLKDNEYFTKG